MSETLGASLPELPPRWRRDALVIAVVFVLARLIVLGAFELRGRHFPYMDADAYVWQATWLAQEGTLAMPDAAGARFFVGAPLLVSLAGRITHEFAWTGVGLNWLLGVGAALAFYRNFPRLDWGCWHALLLPGWVSMTATFHSEAALWCFALIGLIAVRLDVTDRRRWPLLVMGGYTIACRPTAGFILAPMMAWSWLRRGTSWRTAAAEVAAAALLPALVFAWTWRDTGQLFPQNAWQAREFQWWSAHYGGHFPTTVFAWPGQSFVPGLFSPGVRLVIKALNVAHLLLWLGALALAGAAWKRDHADALAALITVELVVNGLFVLSIGGPFGHVIFYRFIATQANAFVVLAWMRHAGLPRNVWWLLAAGSVAVACAAAQGT